MSVDKLRKIAEELMLCYAVWPHNNNIKVQEKQLELFEEIINEIEELKDKRPLQP